MLLQVWAGTEEQGNNQVNIFKDTGYLVTSAVDGYNVCIFAYGQVSLTPITGGVLGVTLL